MSAEDVRIVREALARLERIEKEARANYASMAAHYGDSEEEWWPQLYVALAATEEGAEE